MFDEPYILFLKFSVASKWIFRGFSRLDNLDKHGYAYENNLGNAKIVKTLYKFFNPIKIICNEGKITKNIRTHSKYNIGEFEDVFCVAKGLKPLAALDYSSYGKKKFKKLNVSLINKIIEYAHFKNIKILHNTKKGGMYLKSIFFDPKHYKDALKLMYVLWYDVPAGNEYMIGKLLGYSTDNIIYFYKKNHNINLSPKDIKKFNLFLSKFNPTLENLQGTYTFKIMDLKTL